MGYLNSLKTAVLIWASAELPIIRLANVVGFMNLSASPDVLCISDLTFGTRSPQN